MSAGTLFLVVGPSGAGKDSLLDAAKLRFQDDPSLCFPQRYITRAADAGGEDHIAVSVADFAALDLALSWQAHGLSYGISADIHTMLDAGKSVVINASRSIIKDAEARYPDVRVILISVSRQILKQRLESRGRESASDIEARLQRAEAFDVTARSLITVQNNGSLAQAEEAFARAIIG